MSKRCVSCIEDDGTLVNIWTEKEELFPFLFRILLSFDFFICGQTFYCQQIFLTRMTRGVWIKHPDVAFVHGRGEWILKEVRSIFKPNGNQHLLYRKLILSNCFNESLDVFVSWNQACWGACWGTCWGSAINLDMKVTVHESIIFSHQRLIYRCSK